MIPIRSQVSNRIRVKFVLFVIARNEFFICFINNTKEAAIPLLRESACWESTGWLRPIRIGLAMTDNPEIARMILVTKVWLAVSSVL